MPAEKAQHAHGGAKVKRQLFNVDSSIHKGHQKKIRYVKAKGVADGNIQRPLMGRFAFISKQEDRQKDRPENGKHIQNTPNAKAGKNCPALFDLTVVCS